MAVDGRYMSSKENATFDIKHPKSVREAKLETYESS